MSPDVPRALAGLDERQREAAEAVRGPVCVLAGAGTGKTRVITHRIAHGVDTGVFTPRRVMAVTFTTKAAGEMRGRLRALGIDGVAARTFHSAALAQVNYFWPIVTDGEQAPPLSPNKVRVLADAAREMGLDLDTPTLRDVAADIEWRKVSMLTLSEYARRGRPGIGRLSPGAVADLHAEYERVKDARRQLDFEDILLVCAGMIEHEPRVARAVREQYRHFTVDEYQDVSPLQHRLLQLWLGPRDDLCVVGDASQTIYSFAGADSSFLLDFPRRHPRATVVRLERNYRSSPDVLRAANALMRGRPGALTLVAAEADAAEEGVNRPATTTGVSAYDSDGAEAEGVARAVVAQLRSGARPSEIAVLYRAHAQSITVQQALAGAGVATTVLGGTRFFRQPEVQRALLMLRGESVAGGDRGTLADTVERVLRSLGFSSDPPPAGGALRDAWEAQAALLRLAERAPADWSLRTFTDDLQARARDQHEPEMETVTLATLHAAKGLEWPYVHMIGLSEGLLPISYATGLDTVDEERRLAYVGVTRARRGLALSWARASHRGAERQPSRFLDEMRPPRERGSG